MRTLVFSVTIADCEVQTFRSGGPGGQNQNVRDTGVRVIHRPSGAVGESREHRKQLQNKRAAFMRMARSPKFNVWRQRQLAKETPEQWVEKQLQAKNIKIEIRTENGWAEGHIAGGGG